MSPRNVGESIPANTPHAVSVSLPTWKAIIGYEEGEDWVIGAMTTGYPRFFVNKKITSLAEDIVAKYGRPSDRAMLFPSHKTASRCADFIYEKDQSPTKITPRIVDLVLDLTRVTSDTLRSLAPCLSATVFPNSVFPLAKLYWQHTGDGISSRRAEFCHDLWRDGLLVEEVALKSFPNGQPRLQKKGPRRYQKFRSVGDAESDSPQIIEPTEAESEESSEVKESSRFVEERFGRNLDLSLVENAKSAIRRRIAGSLTVDVDLERPPLPTMDVSVRGVAKLSEDDVYLYQCGMEAIFNSHQLLLGARGSLKSIVFGFPYVDTLKILEKFGPGCIFYGHGSSEDLDQLEQRLKGGEKYLALFCEFPGNPLLKSPDLDRISRLAAMYDFAVVVDETIGNFCNVNVLPFADIVVSSLTKIFTGECNVLGGSSILNPEGKYYKELKICATEQFEDNYWAEDVIVMERNSRDFVSRIERINQNAEMICEKLHNRPSVKTVYYPKCVPSRRHYDACRTPNGGYGGLLSVKFQEKQQAIAFFDRVDTAKGPSLGTNFTLTSPYVILAHYRELEWAQSFGVEPDLIRISVGLEESEQLGRIFEDALQAADSAQL